MNEGKKLSWLLMPQSWPPSCTFSRKLLVSSMGVMACTSLFPEENGQFSN
jgi:hypothetical protein